jgi:hypothetical protein
MSEFLTPWAFIVKLTVLIYPRLTEREGWFQFCMTLDNPPSHGPFPVLGSAAQITRWTMHSAVFLSLQSLYCHISSDWVVATDRERVREREPGGGAHFTSTRKDGKITIPYFNFLPTVCTEVERSMLVTSCCVYCCSASTSWTVFIQLDIEVIRGSGRQRIAVIIFCSSSRTDIYIHTYIHTYIPKYIHTYIHTYIYWKWKKWPPTTSQPRSQDTETQTPIYTASK